MILQVQDVSKRFGGLQALLDVDFELAEGQIMGLIGPNGAGKTTALNAILGLTPYQGELRVLGRDPWGERDQLMRDVCFIADVAVLPYRSATGSAAICPCGRDAASSA